MMKDGYFKVMVHGAFPIKVVKKEGNVILQKYKIPFMESSETREIVYGKVRKILDNYPLCICFKVWTF